MPLYEFEDVETGEPVEEFFHMDDAPSIGVVISLDGRKLRRLVSRQQKPRTRSWEFVAWSLPENVQGVTSWADDGMGGKVPAFSSRKEVQRFVDANEGRYTYGDGSSKVTPG